MALAEPAIPVTLITGFLGAGKTTWLNARLRARQVPDGSLILVNDFGRLQIDAALILAQDEHVIRLANGCVCCVLGDNLAAQLSQISQRPQRPPAIYIECSGIAKPAPLQLAVRLQPHMQLQDTICLVDASQSPRLAADPHTQELWKVQIRAASQLIVNRMHSAVLATELEALLHTLTLNTVPPVRIEYETTPEPAPHPIPVPSPVQAWAHRSRLAADRATTWVSASLVHDGRVDTLRLQSTLHAHSAALHRAKGWVHCQQTATLQLLQFMPGQLRWVPAHHKVGPRHSQLLCIGTAGANFQDCLAELVQQGFTLQDALKTCA